VEHLGATLAFLRVAPRVPHVGVSGGDAHHAWAARADEYFHRPWSGIEWHRVVTQQFVDGADRIFEAAHPFAGRG